jgi:hypothetical protein
MSNLRLTRLKFGQVIEGKGCGAVLLADQRPKKSCPSDRQCKIQVPSNTVRRPDASKVREFDGPAKASANWMGAWCGCVIQQPIRAGNST